MRTAARHSARPAPWGGAAAGLVIALLLLGAPRAGGDPVPGRPPAAGPGTDLGGLAFDSDGRLYAADRRAGRVVVLDPAAGAPNALGAGALDEPTGVAIAPGGDVLVTDRHGVRRFAPDGETRGAWAGRETARGARL